ncbi:hypothetical protein R1sor_003666 [Riccia sorocarpa]|uniref:Uncharacterized protein n=1 Tax=Riccia sorocarpa TaxID=122646 RepID=A0ABD3H658_9MARC
MSLTGNIPTGGLSSPIENPAPTAAEEQGDRQVRQNQGRNRYGNMQWDYQATVAMIEFKISEWDSFEATSNHRGAVVISDAKWKIIKGGLLARGISESSLASSRSQAESSVQLDGDTSSCQADHSGQPADGTHVPLDALGVSAVRGKKLCISSTRL